MDLSSLPEAQKQQLQQLQQQFQEHQQQQQTQYYAQDYASSQQYDPSQIQTQPSYDQSYYSYYQQNPQHSQQSQPQPPQQYDYYNNVYEHQEQHFSQPESVGHIKLAGISEAPLPAGESGGTAWLGQPGRGRGRFSCSIIRMCVLPTTSWARWGSIEFGFFGDEFGSCGCGGGTFAADPICWDNGFHGEGNGGVAGVWTHDGAWSSGSIYGSRDYALRWSIVEKFELAGASPTDLAVMIKNHCSNGTALEGLGFNIDEIVQAWNEMYEAKKWQTGVPSF